MLKGKKKSQEERSNDSVFLLPKGKSADIVVKSTGRGGGASEWKKKEKYKIN